MAHVNFISKIHKSTKRDYVQRVVEYNKAECAKVSKEFGKDYFDGDRKYGYGGYKYDGRWRALADVLIPHYGLKPGDKVLDIGCGKGFLVHDFRQALPGLEAFGADVSSYAIENSMPEVKPFLKEASAVKLPYPDKTFDLVVSINTIHNLRIYDLEKALKEIERVGKKHKYIVTDCYQTEEQKVNLLYWQLTCECFYTPEEWDWIFKQTGYTGDFEGIFFD
jgi:ubiquinone/menaquinone biosynthesis C-methylase UbiE